LMLEQCLNEQAPIKKLSKAKQKLSHKPWITPCFLKSIKTKNRLYSALVSVVKRPMQSIKTTGIKLLIYWKSTKKYYQSQFLSCRNDSWKMWKLINSLISSKQKRLCPPEKLFDPIKSNCTSNPEDMSDLFNTYFVSIGQQLASKIPPPVHHTYPVKVNGSKNSVVLHDTFVEEVNVVINNLLVSKSNRQNDIPTHILKLCKNSLSPFLVQIFKLCIRKGPYPQSLKCAQVVPIYKGGPKDLCTNYTPISFLSPINKIFEKLIYTRLYTYLEQNTMLSSHQYGFRMGLSTTLAIFDMQNILENLQKRVSLLVLSFVTCLKHLIL